MPFTQPTAAPSSPPVYSSPSHSDLAAVAATVSVVGVLMAILLTWLILRLRRIPDGQSQPVSASETSSKVGFVPKSHHFSHRHKDGSWDFADPDPFAHSKEIPPAPSPSPKYRPAPLTFVPPYTPRTYRASIHKDELGPRTPTTPGTPASFDFIEPPPPAYCPENLPYLPYPPGVHLPC